MMRQPKAARKLLLQSGLHACGMFSLEALQVLPHSHYRQGPWNVDLRTPPGPEGSNGSLLDIRRGHPGTFSIYEFAFAMEDLKLLLDERNLSRNLSLNLIANGVSSHSPQVSPAAFRRRRRPRTRHADALA